jgi:hypothetical protein
MGFNKVFPEFGVCVLSHLTYRVCHAHPNFADDPDGQSDYGNPYLFTGRRVDILDINTPMLSELWV